jgi:hypothetical protein
METMDYRKRKGISEVQVIGATERVIRPTVQDSDDECGLSMLSHLAKQSLGDSLCESTKMRTSVSVLPSIIRVASDAAERREARKLVVFSKPLPRRRRVLI